MRIIFPDQEKITRYGRLRPVVFGDENIVNFFKGVVDGDELYEALQGKNLFMSLNLSARRIRVQACEAARPQCTKLGFHTVVMPQGA